MINIEKSIFRAYDIRGIVGEQINQQFASLLARALSTLAHKKGSESFCIGFDGRNSSIVLANAMQQGFQSSGINVINIGMVATPQLYYATKYCHCDCAVMITGSHNPAQYNGFKMIVADQSLALDEITNLYETIIAQDFINGRGKVSNVEIDTAYIEDISKLYPATSQKLIVIDAGNGVTANIAPALFTKLGHQVIPLFCQVDGDFPNHHPDPGNPANMVDLQNAVREHKADIGFAFDGDGDRLGIVTDTGEIIYPDKAMMLFVEDLLSRNPGSEVIVDVKSSPLLVQHIEQHGGKARIWNTGHSLIKRKMKETGALLAGEMSGHIFFAEDWYGFDDALLAGARLAAILGARDEPCSAIFSNYPSWIGTPEINLKTSDDTKFDIVNQLKSKIDFGDCKKIDIDGIRVEYQDRWGLIRCSNTTPMLVLRFEANNNQALCTIIDTFIQGLDSIAPELDQSPLLSVRQSLKY